MTKLQAISIISKAAKIYDKQLNGKNLLIIFGAPNKTFEIETMAAASNFLHLTGVTLNKNECDSNTVFFENARDNKLKESAFNFKDKYAEQKLKVLVQTLKVASNAKMIGDYNGFHVKLQTDKLAGSIKSCIGFYRVGKYYIPNTVLAADIRNETSGRHKILAILSKNIENDKYDTVEMVDKKIDLYKLLENIIKKRNIIEQSLLDKLNMQ